MFWENFIKLCVEHGTKPNPVANKIGLSSGSITKWKNGAKPNDTTLQKIADYFGVSVDYLLGGEKENNRAEIDLTIQRAYDNAPDDIKSAVRKLLDVR